MAIHNPSILLYYLSTCIRVLTTCLRQNMTIHTYGIVVRLGIRSY